MGKGTETEIIKLEVENREWMMQFDHIWQVLEGEMRMEKRIKVWLGQALMPGREVW